MWVVSHRCGSDRCLDKVLVAGGGEGWGGGGVGVFFFFFQAEDGIRDHCVTGVQTCALPIYTRITIINVFFYILHQYFVRTVY